MHEESRTLREPPRPRSKDLVELGRGEYYSSWNTRVGTVEASMAESMYKVIELIGTSKDSWEKAASSVVEEAGRHLRDLRVAEVAEAVPPQR